PCQRFGRAEVIVQKRKARETQTCVHVFLCFARNLFLDLVVLGTLRQKRIEFRREGALPLVARPYSRIRTILLFIRRGKTSFSAAVGGSLTLAHIGYLAPPPRQAGSAAPFCLRHRRTNVSSQRKRTSRRCTPPSRRWFRGSPGCSSTSGP